MTTATGHDTSIKDIPITDTSRMPGSLIVFSDDWGRHPSSCQHLVSRMLDRFPVVWVNTIGTRTPRLDLATVRRIGEKLKQWCRASSGKTPAPAGESMRHSPGPKVVNPRMWPWFTTAPDRHLNRWLLGRQLTPLVKSLPRPIVALTTLPITADLPGQLDVDRWVYYCVDDFSHWPGLDRDTLRHMDREMIRRADVLVAVSETLQDLIRAEGRTATLLKHGIDTDLWDLRTDAHVRQMDRATGNSGIGALPGPRIVFWGVVDPRMNAAWLCSLSDDLAAGTIILVGPQQQPDPQLLRRSNIVILPPVPMTELPSIAGDADVLIMPYADLPVTRAMQPLKLTEYMATGKPVVVSDLPSTRDWQDCLDIANSAEEFSRLVRLRLATGLPDEHRAARRRLTSESWNAKAQVLLDVLSAAARATEHRSRSVPGNSPPLELSCKLAGSGRS
jgi:glycosyltransferase involved in cell wall biosynthesis